MKSEVMRYKNITGLHLEVTTKCNAACPMCARNFKGRVRSELEIVDLKLDQCVKILTKPFLQQLGFISICGVFGDPINNNELIDIVNYIYSCNDGIYINIYTNGGINDSKWWRKLANTLKNGSVIFGIDGIDEVSSIHRRNTDIKVVLRNAKTFIDAGGNAKWEFIAFKHNQYQIKKAKELSEKMGFESFQVKRTSRFFKHLFEEDVQLDSTIMPYGAHPIYDNNGELIGKLELPDEIYRNDCEGDLFKKIDEYNSLEKYYDAIDVKCQAIETEGIFISAKGNVFPCCTVYQQVCYGEVFNVKDSKELNEYRIWKKYSTSALENTIEEIVNGKAFYELQKSWKKESISCGKAKGCCRTCGKEINMHMAQHK